MINLFKNKRKKENSFPGWDSNPQPQAWQSSVLTTVPTRHLMEGEVSLVIFILLYNALPCNILEKGEKWNLN